MKVYNFFIGEYGYPIPIGGFLGSDYEYIGAFDENHINQAMEQTKNKLGYTDEQARRMFLVLEQELNKL